MLTMQAFRDWLAHPAINPDARKDRLARLTQVGREEVLRITSDLTWYVWDAPQA